MTMVWVYVTTGTRDEALAIARAVVAERLAACANVLGELRSLYWWAGKVQDEPETGLILKTRREQTAKLVARVCELHSYECPCVVALPIEGGNPDFLAWIEAETGGRRA